MMTSKKFVGPLTGLLPLVFLKSISVPGVLVLFRQDYVDIMSQPFWKG